MFATTCPRCGRSCCPWTRRDPPRLGVASGAALYVGAVLGPGVLLLPALAAQAAGPASVLAWAGLLSASLAIAVTFAALGVRHPVAGGAAAYVARRVRAPGRRRSPAGGSTRAWSAARPRCGSSAASTSPTSPAAGARWRWRLPRR